MALANWKNQLKIIDQRLAVLNPLLADLGLPSQSPPPFKPPPETGKGAGDARHKAAIALKSYREGLDKQIAQAKKDIAAGKGKSSTRAVTDFYRASDTTPRDFGATAPASAVGRPSGVVDDVASDGGNGLLWAALIAGAYFFLRR